MSGNRPFAVFDIDGTLIRWQLYHAIANQLAKQGYIDTADYEAVRGARMLWKQRTHAESFKEYERRLVSAYEKLLQQLPVTAFETAADAVFYEYKDQVYTYTRDLLKQLKSEGYVLLAISGSQTEIIGRIAGYYGFDDFVGSQYHRRDGRFTGELTATIGNKDTVLRQLIDTHRLSMKGSVAVGDSESDSIMLSMVDRPIAFNPSKGLYEQAREHGWKIVVERKNVVYMLEYRDGTYVLA